MAGESFKDSIQGWIKNSGRLGKLIVVNAAVFLVLVISLLVGKLSSPRAVDITGQPLPTAVEAFVEQNVAAPSTFEGLLHHPWTIVTNMFAHVGPFHFIFNMLVLFFIGRMMVHLLGERRMVNTFILGGLFAYLFHLVSYETIPYFASQQNIVVLGASGAINALFVAVGFYRPKMKVNLFGIIPVPLLLLALVFIFIDMSSVGSGDNTAHMVHLGGALFGGLSVINANSPKNFMNRFDRWISKFKWPKFSFKRKPKMNVHVGGAAKNMSDEEYNYNKKGHQDRVDAILDKISKKGYEGLTKEEKEILFNESKRKK